MESRIAALEAENAALRAEAAFLRQLIDQAPTLVVVRDRAQRLLLAHQLAVHSTGRPLDQPSLHDPQRFTSGIKLPLMNDQGQIYAVAAIISDVTDLKLTDDQITRDTLILANINDAVILTDLNGIVTYWNEGATRIFGWTAEEVLGSCLTARYPEPIRQHAERLIAEILGGQLFDGEWQDFHKDGHLIWIDVRTSVLRDSESTPIGLIGIAHDITARKRAEANFQSYAQRLEALRVIDLAILRAQPLDELLRITIAQLAALLPGTSLQISVFDLAQGAAMTLPPPDAPEESAFGRRYPLPPAETLAIFQQGRPIHIADLEQVAQTDPRYRVLMSDGCRAILATPMVADGQVVGALKIGRSEPGLFHDDEVHIAQDLAAALAVGIAQDHLRAAELQSRQIAQTINAANLALTYHLELSAVIATLLDFLMLLVPYDSAVVYLIEDETTLRPYAMRGYAAQSAAAALHRPFDLSQLPITARVVTQKQGLRLDDIQADPEWVDCSGSEHCHSWLGVPLIAGDQVIGLYSLDKARPGFFSAEHLRRAELLAPQAVVAIENARLFAALDQSRAELQQLSQQLVQVQETERAHLARELHDEIGQLLTGLRFILESDLRTHTIESRPQIRAALDIGNHMIQRVRELSLSLSPPMLDDLGLAATLHWYAGRFTEQTGIAVDFRHSDLDRAISAELALSAYRIIQEALTNVARHAGVAEVTVQVWTTADLLVLQVIDAGRGFDPAALHPAHSGGLTGIRERARLMGGQLTTITAPGQGVRITAEIPLPEQPITRRG